MSRFVVDNSVVVSWYFRDERTPYASAVLRSLDNGQAFVPAIWPLELSNVLLMAERRKRLTQPEVERTLDALRSLSIEIEQEAPDRVFSDVLQLARQFGLTTHDASYLDLAMRMGLPIATLDKTLRQAARKAKVPHYKP